MKISKQSWHYRWLSRVDKCFEYICYLPTHTSLCVYFWLLVFSPIVFVFGCINVLNTRLIIKPILKAKYKKYVEWQKSIGRKPERFEFFCLYSEGLLLQMKRDILYTKRKQKENATANRATYRLHFRRQIRDTWKLLCAFVRAKKDKVCPLISFVEEED